MLSFIRRQMSATNLMVVAALVFAMAGGAFAAGASKRGASNAAHKGHHAKGYVITSVSQIKPSVLKGLVGKVGPVGPQGERGEKGETGAAGKDGKEGLPGKEGKQGEPGNEGEAGTPGESVTVTALTKGSEPNPATECKELGGAKLSNGTGTGYACNGEAASSGPLKSGESESGAWAGSVTSHSGIFKMYLAYVPISYPRPIPQSSQPTDVVVAKETTTTECPGSFTNPSAKPGYLCLYVDEEEQVGKFFELRQTEAGQIVFLTNTEEEFTKEGKQGWAYGTWAVTAK